MEFYRYEDVHYDGYLRVKIYLYKFELLKETPCGYWIIPPDPTGLYFRREEDKKWISKTSRKRYAYPTRIEAMENFKARKKRQIKILSCKLDMAKRALDIVENNPNTVG